MRVRELNERILCGLILEGGWGLYRSQTQDLIIGCSNGLRPIDIFFKPAVSVAT